MAPLELLGVEEEDVEDEVEPLEDLDPAEEAVGEELPVLLPELVVDELVVDEFDTANVLRKKKSRMGPRCGHVCAYKMRTRPPVFSRRSVSPWSCSLS